MKMTTAVIGAALARARVASSIRCARIIRARISSRRSFAPVAVATGLLDAMAAASTWAGRSDLGRRAAGRPWAVVVLDYDGFNALLDLLDPFASDDAEEGASAEDAENDTNAKSGTNVSAWLLVLETNALLDRFAL